MRYSALALAFASILGLGIAGSVCAQNGADMHVSKGIQCPVCHGPDLKNPQIPEAETCMKCHDKALLAEKTKELSANPHNPPHNGDCTLCHMQHEPFTDYCAQCHKFDFQYKPKQ